MSRVIAMAKTPSLNASRRPVSFSSGISGPGGGLDEQSPPGDPPRAILVDEDEKVPSALLVPHVVQLIGDRKGAAHDGRRTPFFDHQIPDLERLPLRRRTEIPIALHASRPPFDPPGETRTDEHGGGTKQRLEIVVAARQPSLVQPLDEG